jgi:hypothetical protein
MTDPADSEIAWLSGPDVAKLAGISASDFRTRRSRSGTLPLPEDDGSTVLTATGPRTLPKGAWRPRWRADGPIREWIALHETRKQPKISDRES